MRQRPPYHPSSSSLPLVLHFSRLTQAALSKGSPHGVNKQVKTLPGTASRDRDTVLH